MLALLGAFQMVYMSTNMTMLQMDTADEFRGRVMGIFMLNQGLLPLGSLFAGTMAEFRSAPFAVLVMGAAVLVLSCLAFLSMPSIRKT